MKVLAFLIALSFVASVSAAETMTGTTPAAETTAMDKDCSKITDKAAKKECEEKAKKEAPASETTPMAK